MLIVLVWTLVAVVALSVALWALWDAWNDLRALHRSGRNGVLKVIAKANIRRELLRVVVQVAFLGLGVLGLLDVPALRVVTAPVLLAAGLAIAAQSVMDRIDRHHALRLLTRQQDDAARAGGRRKTDH